jgi:hypothetical protein
MRAVETDAPGGGEAKSGQQNENLFYNSTRTIDTSSLIDRIIEALGGRMRSDGSAMVHCPAHDDKIPSCHVTPDNDKILVNCMAGCKQDAVIDALKARGLWPGKNGSNRSSNLPPGICDKWHGAEYTAHWPYHTPDGQVIGYAVRYDRQGGKEIIPFFKRDGSKWKAGPAPKPRPLYNLHLLSRHPEKPVLIAEGEKATGAAGRLLSDYVCMTWASGSNAVGMADFKPLKGRDVVIWPDNDDPGHKAARNVAEQCRRAGAASVTTIKPPDGIKAGWDLADAEAEGWTEDKVQAWIEQASGNSDPKHKRIVPMPIADFLALDFPPRDNILNPWLPSQGIAMVYAYRGIGKTFFALSIAYAVTSGSSFLTWNASNPTGVLYIDGEMPAPVMQERLSQLVAGAEQDPAAPFILLTPDLQPEGMPRIDEPEGQQAIEDILTPEIKLIVVDNISTLTGAKENEADGWTPVQAWALKQRQKGRTVLFVHHAGKGGSQRGTSRREDVLDTVMVLKRPIDYCADQGAVFEIHFEKARGLYGDDVAPVEARLSDTTGVLTWDWRSVEGTTFDRVVDLSKEGLSQKEIADELQLNKSTVSRHIRRAKNEGYLS